MARVQTVHLQHLESSRSTKTKRTIRTCFDLLLHRSRICLIDVVFTIWVRPEVNSIYTRSVFTARSGGVTVAAK